jgi:hypothetical protein
MFAFLRINARALLVTLGAAAWAVTPFAAFSQPRSQPAATDLAATLESGFARLVFTFPEEIKTDVQLCDNNVLVIRFAKPVRVAIDRRARRSSRISCRPRALDPDGSCGPHRLRSTSSPSTRWKPARKALRRSCFHRSWVGLPPGLPQEVVDELAKRARDAEAHQARVAAGAQGMAAGEGPPSPKRPDLLPLRLHDQRTDPGSRPNRKGRR